MEDDHDPLSTHAQKFFINGRAVDIRAGTIECSGGPQRLEPRIMSLLVALVAGKGEVVTRDELIDTVWSGAAGADQSLNQAISRLRGALGDSPFERAYIETVPKRGYRLIVDIELPQPDKSVDDAQAVEEKTDTEEQRMAAVGSYDTLRLEQSIVRRRWFAVAAVLASVILAVIYQLTRTTGPAGPPEPEIFTRSIAVLPFVNMSDDASNEYFSDGISEELLNLLTKIPQLRVISRSSAFSYKGKHIDIPTIAAQLNVAYVLEGSVRKVGNQVRISVQLIEARSDTHLWSETYERTLDDIFAIQDEIASEVVEQLKITLLGDAPTVQAADPAAYALVLQARYLSQQVTPDALEKSIALFEQALAIDPDYAAAWAGLARGYTRQAGQGLRPIDEGYRLARKAADRALALDPAHVPAYISLAGIARSYDRDFVAATRHYQRALAIEPANTDSIAHAASMAGFLGRLDQAIALAEYAVARDPVSPIRNASMGLTYHEGGRLDEAIASFRTALNLSPGYIGAQYSIGTALLLKGDPESALAAMQNEAFEAWRLIGLVMAHHALGQAAASDAALATLIEMYEQEWAYNITYVLAFRGEADRAFEWLNKAAAYNDPGLAQIATQPLFDHLQSDPRWLPFLESIGMSPEQLAAIEFEVMPPE